MSRWLPFSGFGRSGSPLSWGSSVPILTQFGVGFHSSFSSCEPPLGIHFPRSCCVPPSSPKPFGFIMSNNIYREPRFNPPCFLTAPDEVFCGTVVALSFLFSKNPYPVVTPSQVSPHLKLSSLFDLFPFSNAALDSQRTCVAEHPHVTLAAKVFPPLIFGVVTSCDLPSPDPSARCLSFSLPSSCRWISHNLSSLYPGSILRQRRE